MKRSAMRMTVFLLLGAIVNVAVAWGLTASGGIGPRRNMPERIFPDAGGPMLANWVKYRPSGFAVEADNGFEFDHIGFTSGMLHAESEQAVIMVAGLPSRSLIGYRFEQIDDSSAGWRTAADAFTRLPMSDASDDDEVWLPLRPIWPGFAINTVFYAFVLWVMFAAPFALRRRMRIKRGLCPKCAYPVGTNAVCTECGAPR